MVISVAVVKQQNAKVLNAFVLSEELSVDLNVMVLLRQTVLTNKMNKTYFIIFHNGKLSVNIWTVCHLDTASQPILHA
jgi:hypothetical protein